MTQRDRVLRYLYDFGSITALEAMRDLGVHRLAARVLELRLDGHDIDSEMVAVTNRYGEATKIARYTMARPRQPRTPRRPFRTFTGVRRDHVEAVLLAHVMGDDTGAAARLLLAEGAGLAWSPLAMVLVGDLETWRREGAEQSPCAFVTDRWYEREGNYRNYVGFLLDREVPTGRENERAVREAIQRLRLAERAP